ncbi:EAL domain-containing protein [Alteromonas confluentis]|uniref:Diguanylate phosphodiesterase n=1 Tax=Alteromonas confluentis TaxID=1656094 RepID=A0A1E7Z5D8_9ALTE|nr:EAL domain-containing protein [Alteromonas confluentis]OFC68756.1 hypothetical protein BFC18_00515 [Alteromonas confluentis]
MTEEQLFTFTPEAEDTSNTSSQSAEWLVLSVEDDPGYQQSLKLGLNGLTVRGRPIRFLTANSATQASSVLAENDGIAVILLDVVMEQDNAGLFLVNTIRTILGNSRVRIILLTGQPGMAPRQDTLKEYDIDEYWNKVDLTEEKLRGIVSSNIKTWSNLTELFIAKRGLQMIVDASRALTSKQDVSDFTYTVLKEVSRVIGIPDTGGMVCASRPSMASLEQCEVVATSGEFSQSNSPLLANLLEEQQYSEQTGLIEAINEALAHHEHQFFENWSILYFDTADVDNNQYLIVVKSPKPLEPSHITLLMVFSENISNGFVNLALMNKLSMLAYYDEALGVPNKHWLEREISSMSTYDRSSTSLVFLSILDFSTTEITLGTNFSSLIVSTVLEKIKATCQKAMTICYLEDGRFAILYRTDRLTQESNLDRLASQTVVIDGVVQRISNNISHVGVQDLDALDLKKSIKTAQLVHNSPRLKLGAVYAITKAHIDDINARHTLLKSLSDALDDGSAFFLEFQPKVNLHDGRPVGVEALLRWQFREGEVLPPGAFIPLAEASGLITKLDSLVMELAVSAARELAELGNHFAVAFNVTHADVMSPSFIPHLEQLLKRHQVKPEQIEIEITETQAMADYEGINPILETLINMGITISIDDFGTGYSSLAHLSTLSASTLKVDKSFVDTLMLGESNSNTHILDMVYRLSRQCHFKIIAEGIETETQRDALINKGYETGQGFLFSKPLPLPALIDWLKKAG